MVSKGQKRDTLRRRRPSRDPKRRILIVCEGKVTEPGYFHALKHELRNPLVHVETIEGAGVPRTVVARAVEARREAERRAGAERDDNLRFDEVWAVFDVDDHPHLAEARAHAAREQIACAVSNPCFELWALLHYEDHRREVHRRELPSMLRKHQPDYEKALDYARMKAGAADAARRAQALDDAAERDGVPDRNPSTGVHRLVVSVRRG